ncbi:isoprenylcysteine carboxylmethyltransferase family protein [Marinilabilia sp.]|uniref:methyltransferase family protein n=1 Tax=Marinilabilia sp. TaxID=2021252 RepID=UPI0025B85656|nr:isoprenylcysteine carboxylmethyltransferase family protein [Marinilabilia sp.]
MLVVFVIPSYLTYKRTGINPFRFNKEESAINYVGKAYKILAACAFVLIVINAFFPSVIQYLTPIEVLETEYLCWIGFGLLHLSFIVIFIAQRNMGNQWRIGIDDRNKTNLVTKGLFSWSRNPVFLGVILVFLGLFLIIPNVATAIILVSGYLIIQIQVRLEEEFLSTQLGKEYHQYKKNVKRWLL